MSWSHHREPAPGRVSSLLSGASTKVVAIIAVIFVAGLSFGVGASWLLSSPASPPRVAADPSPPAATNAPATTAQAASNSENAAEPCERQTWPYVDDKCRAQLAQKSQASRQVRVISTDKSAPPTIVSTPAPPQQSRPVETATRETVGRAPTEAPRPEPVASAPPQQAPQPPQQAPKPTMEGQQTASTARIAPELSTTASIQPPAAAPVAPPKASPPPAPTASTQPATTASTPQPASNESARPEVLNDIKAAEDDSTRSKRTKRAERAKDRQNRAARVRSIPQNDNRDAYGATVRTYEMEGGGRVTVYQRGPSLQVGDRVDFGDSARSRRRVTTERAERRYGSRDDDASSETRGFGEFFFGR